ncbi:MAG TPA: enoyl-CoA hydratase-related protein, partial [Microthrixaceae bacterium]|nr:enoyl-CoA hydratase-related protein [Microthrixaceae bacterium]
MPTCFDVEIADGIATLRLNRPEAYNTMVPEFWFELPELVLELDRSGDVRALILSSTGKHFCAGMDLGVFTGGTGSLLGGDDVEEIGRKRAALFDTVLRLQD